MFVLNFFCPPLLIILIDTFNEIMYMLFKLLNQKDIKKILQNQPIS